MIKVIAILIFDIAMFYGAFWVGGQIVEWARGEWWSMPTFMLAVGIIFILAVLPWSFVIPEIK